MRDPAGGGRLVRMADEHLAATLRWLRDPELRRQLDSLGEPTAEGNAAYWRARWGDPTQAAFAVLDAGGTHVGNAGLVGIDRARRKAELWIYLGERRGSGIGSAVLAAVLEHAFVDLGLNRVWLRVLATNSGAERFYLRHGFRAEGRLRQDTWWEGEPVDALVLSILAAEWSSTAARVVGEVSTR